LGEAGLVKPRYTLRGAAELDEILAYIEQRSPQGARHVQARIQAIINLLLQYPHAGQPTSKGRLRRVVASPYPYLIFYEAAGDEIIIHAVRHASRKP
jgi:toxin ParE1/3/4